MENSKTVVLKSGRLQEVVVYERFQPYGSLLRSRFRLVTSRNPRVTWRDEPKNGCEGDQPYGFNWENFGVLDKLSFMGGGRLREVVAHGGSAVYM